MKKSNIVFNVLHSSKVEKNTKNATASKHKNEKYSVAYNYDSFNELSNAVIVPRTPELYNSDNKAFFKDSFFSKDFKTKNKGNSNLKLSSSNGENENSENCYLDYISPYLEKDELGGSSSLSYVPVKTFSNTTLNQIINQVDNKNIINNNNLKMSYLKNTTYPTNSSNITNDTNDVSCFNNKNSQTQLPQSSNLYDPSINIKSFTSIDTLSTKHTKQDKNTFLEEFYQNSNPDFDFEDWNSFSAAYNNSRIHDNKSPDLLGSKRDPKVDIFLKNEINNIPISNNNGVLNIKKINEYNNSINNTPYTCFNQDKSNFVNYNINDGESLVSNLNVIYDQYSYSTSKPYNKSILNTLNNNNDIYHFNNSNHNNVLDLNEDNNKPSSNTPNDKTKNSKGKRNKRSNKLNASKKNLNQITNITNINNNTSITNITNIDNNNNNNTSTHSIVDFNPKMHCKFITKLVELLDSTDISDIISWNCDGTIIEIKNQSRFIEEVLPKHFKHNNYSNFTRQFNLYNFKKVKKYPYPNIIAYYNINFIKGRYELLFNIKRQDNNHPSSNKNKINNDTINNENFSLGTSHKFINKNDKVSTKSNNSNNSNNCNQTFVNAETNCNDAGSSKENNEPKKTQTEEKKDNNTASANNVNSTSNNTANNTTYNETANKDNCNDTNKTHIFIKSTGSLPNLSTSSTPKNSTFNEINECCQKTIESVNSKIEFLSSKMLLLEEQVKSISQFNDALIERNTSLFEDLKSKDYYIKLLESLLLFGKETSNAPVKSITNNKADINSLIGGTKNDVNQKDKYLINSILNNKALLDEIVQGFENSNNNSNNNKTNNKTTNNNMNYYSNKQIYDNNNSNTNNNLNNSSTKEKEANTFNSNNIKNTNNIKNNKNLKNELLKYPVFPIQSNNNMLNEMMNTNTSKDTENMNMNSLNNMNNMSSPSSELSHFNNIFSVNNHFDSGFNKQESFKNLFSFSNNKDTKKDGNDNTEFSNFHDEYFK